MVSTASVERELWQARAGGLYSLLVATQVQTRLPIAGRLVPSEDDLERSLYLAPAAGLAMGLLWAAVAAIAVELGAAPLVCASFVVAVMVVSEGLCFERALAGQVSNGLRTWRESLGQVSDGDDVLLTKIGVVALSVVLRTAALVAIAPAAHFEGLVAAAVLSRWTLSLGPLLLQIRSTASEVKAMLRNVLMLGATLLVMVLCHGATGVLLMALCAAGMALITRRAHSAEASIEAARSLALAALLLALLC